MTARHDLLRELVEEASDGPWLAHKGRVYRHACPGHSHDAHDYPCYIADTWHQSRHRPDADEDAYYIAALDPPTVKAMLDVIDAAVRLVHPMRGELKVDATALSAALARYMTFGDSEVVA